ncbi:MAG: hypothetical protein LBG71_03180 [Clostridiales Family XIII bacterium]|jgi:hypothetical protein|nr:hypothetical protein [Clostridiales Family XIII bacterium]
MGKISRVSKAIISLNFILIAAVFITSAIYTVNVLAQGGSGSVEVRYAGFPVYEEGAAENGPNTLLAPGYYTTTVAAVANVGEGVAFAELLLPQIYLYRDAAGRPLKEPTPAPEGMVTIKVDILTVSAIGEPINLNYINNYWDLYEAWREGRTGLVRHFALFDKQEPGKILRHFFEFDVGDEYTPLNPDGTPVLDASGNPVRKPRPVEIQFRLTVDARTNALYMTNEWNGAQMRNLGFKAAPADSTAEILTELGLTAQEFYDIDWAETRSFFIMPVSN